ncbi:MAG: methyl-accepting chemotaxis protein [Candidatus Zixiibacteriota bacterium]
MLANWKNKSLRFKLISGTLISLLPVMVIVYFTYNYNKNASLENSGNFMVMMNEYESSELNAYLEDQMAIFNEWVADDIFGLAIEFNTLEEINGNFQKMLEFSPGYRSLRLADINGKVVASAGKNESNSIILGQYDGKTVNNIQTYIGKNSTYVELAKNESGYSNSKSGWTMLYTFPAKNSSGKVNGLFIAELDWSYFDQHVVDMSTEAHKRGFKDAKAVIINTENGTSICHSVEENAGKAFTADNDFWTWLNKSETINEFEIEKEGCYSIYAWIHDGTTIQNPDQNNINQSKLRQVFIVPKSTILAKSQTILIISLFIALGGIIIALLIAYFLDKAIVKPIKELIVGLLNIAEQVGSASNQVASSSQSLAEGASETASSLEETSSALEQMASMTRQNADNTKQANSLVLTSSSEVEKGVTAMNGMSSAMQDIKKSSDETAKIIKVIDEIAFQTNLLALNAAVEAARAGEAGKGFAVVAEEVRNLAQRSAEAAKNTSLLIEGSQKSAEAGVKSTGELVGILKNITDGIQKVTNLMSEVSAASNEQAQGIDQVNKAVNQMDQVTQQNASNAEESSSASEELASQAQQMQKIVHDLTLIIHGASEKSAVDHNTFSYNDQTANKPGGGLAKNLSRITARKKNNPKPKESKKEATSKTAEEVIPLEQDDMANF